MFSSFYAKAQRQKSQSGFLAFLFLFSAWCSGVLVVHSWAAQIESVETTQTEFYWVSHGHAEGHLATGYSPSGAFSPDGSVLAVANGNQVVLMNLNAQGVRKVLHPGVERVNEFETESASFLTPDQIFILGRGLVQTRAKDSAPRTPQLALRWDTTKDALVGKIHGVSGGQGYGPARWFPDIQYLGLSKQNAFELWNPLTVTGGRIVVPTLTRPAGLFAFSPDGRWLLLAQIEATSRANPIVVQRADLQFVNILEGHLGAVLSMMFSRDSSKVVTACEDGKVRIFSAGDWKLLHTLQGHEGLVHWAEFSPNGRWVASAGEDKTVRVWSVASGELLQTLKESQEPILTVAFSPNSNFLAASTAKSVLVWRRMTGGL